jgi:hypothetical protein
MISVRSAVDFVVSTGFGPLLADRPELLRAGHFHGDTRPFVRYNNRA